LVASVCCALAIIAASFYLDRGAQGDTVTYVDSINFLETGIRSDNFAFNRIITTFGGLWSVIFFSKIFGLYAGWLVLNSIFYLVAVVVFFKLSFVLLRDKKASLMATLFLAANYALVRFGLNYLMDMGGWAFYLVSLYYIACYAVYSERGDMVKAAIFVGLGGLFKEYALLGSIAVAVFLLYENRRSFLQLVKNSILPTLLCFGPIALLYAFAYWKYDYTYLDWFSANTTYYEYASRIVEYIKALGSLHNVLALLSISGLICLIRQWREIEVRKKVFLVSVALSFLPVFFWPAITQRVMFVTVPFAAIVASFLFKRYNRYYPVYGFAAVLYLFASLFMDSYILPNLNLPF
jgi:4-amino-4-deoxy-L-arabinose transferase-like glycosyltransferase